VAERQVASGAYRLAANKAIAPGSSTASARSATDELEDVGASHLAIPEDWNILHWSNAATFGRHSSFHSTYELVLVRPADLFIIVAKTGGITRVSL
jgi:hypothetical protein